MKPLPKILALCTLLGLMPQMSWGQTDDEYAAAQAALESGKTYLISTVYYSTTYYLTENGYLTDEKDEAGLFEFKAVTGGYYVTSAWWVGNSGFSNPPSGGNPTLNTGKISQYGSDMRSDWEAQVFYLGADDKYAVRCTNAAAGDSGWNLNGSCFWTVNDGPVAEYSFEPNYVWEVNEFDDERLSLYETVSSWLPRLAQNSIISYTSNAKDPSEGSYEALLDGDYTSFFHSTWHSSNDPGEDHYLQAQLPDATQTFRFYFKKRSQNNNNRPTEISISASNDGVIFTDITAITEGLPTDASITDYLSDVIDLGETYTYIRFTIPATNNMAMTGSHVFFTFSEFYILQNDDLADAILAYTETVKAYTDIDPSLADEIADIELALKEWETSHSTIITFSDAAVKQICVENWDANGDDELSKAEAASVTDLGQVFSENGEITTFDELQYFTGLTSISNNAFYQCTNLGSIKLPSTIKSIGVWAFAGCTFKEIELPEGLTSIGTNAFRGSQLTTLTLPGTTATIGDYAYSYNSSLTSVIIPLSVQSIGTGAFYYCSALTSVTSHLATPFNISSDVFEGINNTCRLYVPVNTKELYNQAEGWYGHFNQIVEMGEKYLALITDCSQLSSPWSEPTEGDICYLLDGDPSTFWHSIWTNGSVENHTHYIQVELNEPVENFIALRVTRRPTTNDHITKWSAYGSSDPDAADDDWTKLADLSTPYVRNTETVTSGVFDTQGYQYLRFYIDGTQGEVYSDRGYGHMSEFQLLEYISDRVTYVDLLNQLIVKVMTLQEQTSSAVVQDALHALHEDCETYATDESRSEEELREVVVELHAQYTQINSFNDAYGNFQVVYHKITALPEPNEGTESHYIWEDLISVAEEYAMTVDELALENVEDINIFTLELKDYYNDYLSSLIADTYDLVDGSPYYIMHVGTGQFLTGANSWGTQISLSDNGEPCMEVLLERSTETLPSSGIETTGWRMRLNGSFDFDYNGSTRTISDTYLFRSTEESGFIDLNAQQYGYLWTITQNEQGNYYIQTVAADTYFPDAVNHYAGATEAGSPVAFNLSLQNEGIEWMFIPVSEYDGVTLASARDSLAAVIDRAEAEGVDATEASAVYDNHAATLDELLQTTATLKEAIAQKLIPAIILPWGLETRWTAKYVFNDIIETDENGKSWTDIHYDDSSWQTMEGPLFRVGASELPCTYWANTGTYYLRRTFHLSYTPTHTCTFYVYHDDDVHVFLNGQLVAEEWGYNPLQVSTLIIPASAFVEGDNELAIYVHDGGGDAFLDYSLVWAETEHTDKQGLIYIFQTDIHPAPYSAYIVTGHNSNLAENIVIPDSVNGVPVKSVAEEALYGTSMQTLTIEEGVESVGMNAFASSPMLTTISLPASLNSLSPSEDNPFMGGSPSIISITVAADNPVYDSRKNCNAVIETATNMLLVGCSTTIIPESVTQIAVDAFSGAGFTEFTIPKQIVSIGNIAFNGCEQLTSLTSYIEKPFEIPSDVFEGINSECVLYVPLGTKVLYEQTEGWYEHFADIQEFFDENTPARLQALIDHATTLSETYLYLPVKQVLIAATENATAVIAAEDEASYVTAFAQLNAAVREAEKSVTEYDLLQQYLQDAMDLKQAYGPLLSDEVKAKIDAFIQPLQQGHDAGALSSEDIAQVWPNFQQLAKAELQAFVEPLTAKAQELQSKNLPEEILERLTYYGTESVALLDVSELTVEDAPYVKETFQGFQQAVAEATEYADWLDHLTDELTVGKELTALLVNPDFDSGLQGWTSDGLDARVNRYFYNSYNDCIRLLGVITQEQARFSQTIELPAGFYAIDADIYCVGNCNGFLFAESNGQMARRMFYAKPDADDVQLTDLGHRVLVQHDGGPLTIGIGFDNLPEDQVNVTSFDNFRLFVEQAPSASDLAILQQAITQLGTTAWAGAWDFKNNPYNLEGVRFEGGNVTTVDLANLGLTGTFPSALLTLPQLTRLDLSGNGLSGKIENTLAALVATSKKAANLLSLDLTGNRLSGNIGVLGVVCPALTQLNAAQNGFETVYPMLPATLTDLDLSQQAISTVAEFDLTKGSVASALSGFPTLLLYDHEARQLAGDVTLNCQIGDWDVDIYRSADGEVGWWFRQGVYRGENGALLNATRVDGLTDGSIFQMRFTFPEGDADINGAVDVIDVQATVNYILNGNPTTYEEGEYGFNYTAVNLWADDRINVQDAVCLVNKILDGNEVKSEKLKVKYGTGAVKMSPTPVGSDDVAYLYWHDGELILSTPEAITAADICIETDAEVEWLLGQHGFSVAQRTNSTHQRTVAYSFSDAELPIGETAIARITDGKVVRITAVTLSNKDARRVNVQFNGLTDEIENSTFNVGNDAGTVYDMAGRKIQNRENAHRKLSRGIYVRDGKKVVK